MNYEIVHYPEKSTFETIVDGYTAYLSYILDDNFIDIVSTYVPSPIEGKGIAGALVKTACEFAQKQKLKIIPSCSYVGIWLQRHPEYQ